MKRAAWVLACVVFATLGCSGSNGAPGATGSKGDPGIVWQGTWSAGTAYTDGDAVQFNGSAWVSVQDANQGNSPDSSPTFWQLLAMKGDTGDTGGAGTQGPAGLACWDLNGNSACDTGTEDFTGDSMCTVADCREPGSVASKRFSWSDAMATDMGTVPYFSMLPTAASEAARYVDGAGYVWTVKLGDGTTGAFDGTNARYFQSADCTGQDYIDLGSLEVFAPGYVVFAWDTTLDEAEYFGISQDVQYFAGTMGSHRDGPNANPCDVGGTPGVFISYGDLTHLSRPGPFTPPFTATPVP